MTEGFVETMKRAFLSKPDAATAVRNFAVAFEYYIQQHPDIALKYRSPSEFRLWSESSIQV